MAPNWLTSFSSRFSMQTLIEKTGQNLITLLYHGVNTGNKIPFIDPLYPSRSAEVFEQDILFFKKHFESVSLSQIYNAEGQFSKPSFHMTFDDGLRSVYDVALPILQKHKVDASIFLNNDFIDNKGLFYRYKVALIINALKKKENSNGQLDNSHLISWLLELGHQDTARIDKTAEKIDLDFGHFLKNETPYLSTTQIKEMQKLGIEFGAHSFNHPHVQEPKDNMHREISKSIEDIQTRFSPNLLAFAFPFSDAGLQDEELTKLHQACDISFGTAGLKLDPAIQHYQRIPMEKNKLDAASIIKNVYLYYWLSSLIGKHKIVRI